MNEQVRIEVDEETAEVLRTRAAARGITVRDLLAEFAREDSKPVEVSNDLIAELDRRWAAVMGGRPTVSSDKVVRWLETWGTPSYRSWRDQ